MSELKNALDANFGQPVGGNIAPAMDMKDMTTEMKVYEVVRKILSTSGSMDIAKLTDEVASMSTSPTTGSNTDFLKIQGLLNRTPAFGNDIDEVDIMARKCAQIYCKEVEKYTNPRGGQFQAGIYPVSANVLFGKDVAALPDGRLAKMPLADGVSPRAGKDVNGPTAAANSVAKLDHFSASNGTLYNQKFLPAALEGDKGLQTFAALVRSYFDHKGMHVQFNVIDKETLLAAQRDPDSYRDLVVRVAGYSAQFTVLAKEVQDDIISRTEQSF